MRASLEVKDYSGAASRGNDLDVIGIPADLKPAIAVLRGRLAEALGRDKDALAEYKAAAAVRRPAVGDGSAGCSTSRCARSATRSARKMRCANLETLSVTWRGDGLEVKALSMMARIYSDTGRYGESLGGRAHRDQAAAEFGNLAGRRQDDAAALFAQLFLSPKGDDLPPVDALALFYEYQRADADRAARRRNDPPPRGPSGGGRPARSGQRAVAIPGRSRGSKARRARRSRHGWRWCT